MSEPFPPPLESLRTFIAYIVPQWGAFVFIYSNNDLLSLHVIMKSFFNGMPMDLFNYYMLSYSSVHPSPSISTVLDKSRNMHTDMEQVRFF